MGNWTENAKKLKALGIQPWPVTTNKEPTVSGWANTEGWEPPEFVEYGGRQVRLEELYTTGAGWLTGRRSWFLEMLEFEGRATELYDEFCERLEAAGMLEVWERIVEGCSVTSPSGGIHFFFRTEGPSRPNTKLAMRPTDEVEREAGLPPWVPMIETRGEGGFVVGVGSNGKIHPTGGAWKPRTGKPATIVTITCAQRDAIFDIAASFDERISTPKTEALPSGLMEMSNGDLQEYVRHHVGVDRLLLEDGWTHSHDDHTGAQHWTRPHKDVRDGTSATLYVDGVLVVWTSTVTPSWDAVLAESRTGWAWVAPVGVLAAVRHSGDLRAAMSWVRGEITASAAEQQPERPGDEQPVVAEAEEGGLTLPAEFWERTELLRQVRDAAWEALVPPDALFASLVTRWSAKISPSCKLPAIVGSEATLDFIAAVVAPSSGGKTISNGVAKRLQPIKDDGVILADQSPGSGEGLIQAFMDWERNDKGKKVGDPSYKHSTVRAIHLVADEGSGLQEQAGRDGSTIMQTLCSAWSGAQLGQLNAKQETKRIVPAGKRRVAATINIQTKAAHVLFGKWSTIGLPQRILFTFAVTTFPDEDVLGPERLRIGPLPTMDAIRTLEVDDAIRTEIRDQRRAVASGKLILPELDGHRLLLQLKLAAILAVVDGRMNVSNHDWATARIAVDTSARVRTHLLEVASQEMAKQAADIGRRQARIDDARDEELDVAEMRKVDRLADRIAEKVADGPIGRRALAKMVTSSKTRQRFDDALDAAVRRGLVRLVETDAGPGGETVETA